MILVGRKSYLHLSRIQKEKRRVLKKEESVDGLRSTSTGGLTWSTMQNFNFSREITPRSMLVGPKFVISHFGHFSWAR